MDGDFVLDWGKRDWREEREVGEGDGIASGAWSHPVEIPAGMGVEEGDWTKCLGPGEGLGENGEVVFPMFPRGFLTLVAGEPGTGKSLLAIEAAARVTRGSALFPAMYKEWKDNGYDADAREHAILCVKEDSEATVKRRLAAAGADMKRVEVWQDVNLLPTEWRYNSDQSNPIKPSTLTLRLRERERVGVVVLDPLPAFLGMKDVSHAATVRHLMADLLEWAGRRRVAVIGVIHVGKRGGGRQMNRPVGSHAYTGLARSVVEVRRDDEGYVGNRRLVLPVKNTFAEVKCGYGFRIGERAFPRLAEGLDNGAPPSGLATPYVMWEAGEVRHRLVRSAGAEVSEREETGEAVLEMAKAFLRMMMREGEVGSRELMEGAREVGIGARVLAKAKMKMGVRCWREGGREGRWVVGRKPNVKHPT